ncbi:MAG TPA: G-D-S-L family lipolytic protein [Cyanothece sp. UBA12306]|nr:G-D-S-L family lipolytic protein [Cyanothece sp. UBA12306]
MSNKNQKLLTISLSLNVICLIFLILFIARKGGISYVKSKVSFLIPSSQEKSINSPPKPRIKTYKTNNYISKIKYFQQLPNSEQEIIFLGDSLTDQGNWSELLKNGDIINRGIAGDTTDGVLNRINEVIESKPQKIFIMIGINDIWNENKILNDLITNYQQILTIFKTQIPKTQVYIQSILPINNEQYSINVDNNQILAVNEELKKIASKFNYQYLDLHSKFVEQSNQLNPEYTNDGVHLNLQGYLLWTDIIKLYVNK